MGVNRKRGEGRGKDGGMGARRGEGMGFSEIWNYNCQYALQCQLAPPYQISCRSVKPFRRYGRILNFSRRRPSAILDFQKLEILTAHILRMINIQHHAKLCADRSNNCGDIAVFLLSRWRPSAIGWCRSEPGQSCLHFLSLFVDFCLVLVVSLL